MWDYVHVRIVCEERLPGRFYLGFPHVVVKVQYLPLEVGKVDGVEVDDPDGADARKRQVDRYRRPQSTGADNQHLRVQELALSSAAHLGHDDMTAIPLDLVRGQGLGLDYHAMSSMITI